MGNRSSTRFRVVALLLFCSPLAKAQVNEARNSAGQVNRQQELQQFEEDTRLRADTEIPPTQRALFDYGGYFSPQYFSLDDANHNNHGFREYDLVGYVRANIDGAQEVFVRGRTDYIDYNPGDSFDQFGSHLVRPDVDRAYYKFDLQAAEQAYNHTRINGDFLFEGGRDFVYWGNGLVLAETIDGVMPVISVGQLSLATVAGVTPTRTVDIFPDRPSFDFDTRRGFYGGILSLTVAHQHPYIYGLVQRDYNGDHNLSTIGNITTRYSYNSEYLGLGSTGQLTDHFRYGVESAVEFGNTLSDSSEVAPPTPGVIAPGLTPVHQTRDDIRAYAADVKLDYLPQDENNSRFSSEVIFATGDSDRGLTNTTFNGNKPGSQDHAFNGFGLLNTGLAFAAPTSNLLALRLGAATFPVPTSGLFRRFQIGTDIFIFGRPNASAPIEEETVSHSSYLGWEPDVYLNWQIVSDVTLAVRYGTFIPNSNAFSDSRVRQFLYTGVTFAF